MKIGAKIASITDKGLNPQYTVNEDSHLVLKKSGIFAVADGVGGANAGDVASQTALNTIRSLVEKSDQTETDYLNFVKTLIESGNNVVYEIGQKRKEQIASTIALMAIEEDYAVLGHVGDSRIYVQRDGKLTQLTRDHSKLQSLIDNSLITPEEQANFKERNVITKALGAQQTVEPGIQKVMLKNNDIFVLCTDGIYVHNSDEEMQTNINQNEDQLQQICEQLKQNCYHKGAKDNLTAIVIKIEDREPDYIETRTVRMRDIEGTKHIRP